MKKIFLFAIVIIFFGCIAGCSCQYEEHFYASQSEKQEIIIDENKNIFSSGEIIDFPRKGKDDFLITAIDNAQEKIWIELYSFTKNQKIYDALLRAKNRNVDIKILLEGNVYGTPTINIPTRNFLQQNNIDVKYTDNDRFTFTHAKFWIIDDEYFISTGNWTASFFNKNREYIFHGKDLETREFLEKIFQSDYDWKPFDNTNIPDHIVMSPINSRAKIEQFILNTETEIWLYVQTISDENILQNIQNLIEKGKKVHICTADNSENQKSSQKFEKGIWKFGRKPYLHAKIMLRDDGIIFLGSENFTTNSLGNNREMGVWLTNRNDMMNFIKKQIQSHCED